MYEALISRHNAFYQTHRTTQISYRHDALEALRRSIKKHERAITEALFHDLHKSWAESYTSEIACCYREIALMKKRIAQWSRPQAVAGPRFFYHARAWLQAEPYGTVLVIAPWNYPFQLALMPVIGAIAAGNTVVLKVSESAPRTGALVQTVIKEALSEDHVSVVTGGSETAQALLASPFDYIFFTGGTAVGKRVMQKAADHLTPVTLELGGKSPCIVHHDAPLAVSARRIAWGKFLNAGQSCIAPDHLWVHESIRDEFLSVLTRTITKMYGADPRRSPDYGRIISEKHYDRLVGYLSHGTVFHGGAHVREDRYLAPTILVDVSWESACMQDEIFGPLLPVFFYRDITAVITHINARPKPLALYLFTNDPDCERTVLSQTSSGGVCINDTVIHFTAEGLPFGGVGMSGIGAYHGKASFDTFSHYKSICKNSFFMDMVLRYPPVRWWAKKILRVLASVCIVTIAYAAAPIF